MAVKINSLELENVKRIKAVKLDPKENGLTIIGGNNNQGKTSVLDSIAWVLGGEKLKPSNAAREGSSVPPSLKITLSNGLIVERKGKNSALMVTDPAGRKGGQKLLDSFIEQLALNLPRFMNSTSKEKANTLLQIIGVEQELAQLNLKESTLYQERLTVGRIADQKSKFAKEMEEYPEVGTELVSASELIRQQQEILARNGENQRKRNKVTEYEREVQQAQLEYANLAERLKNAENKLANANKNLAIAKTDVMDLVDQSTEELENNINNIEEINRKVRANLDKEKAGDEAKQYNAQYAELDNQINGIRKAKFDLLDKADLPLKGLSVEDGELTYNGKKWDSMSGSEQLRVSTAIVRKLNPDCGFVLLDKLEQMDMNTLREFCEWLEDEGLQAIGTRVSTGDECSIIIEDGYSVETNGLPAVSAETPKTTAPKWQAGKF